MIISGGVIFLLLIVGIAFIMGRKSVPTNNPPPKPNNPLPPPPTPPNPNPKNPPSPNNPPTPPKPNQPPIPPTPSGSNSEAKKLASLIKADLQDALNNDSRWKRTGYGIFFQEYHLLGDNMLAVYNGNSELKEALEQNFIRNKNQRGYYSSEEVEKKIVQQNELEPTDWQEIVNLYNQIQPLKEQKDAQQEQEINSKLDNNSDLFLGISSGSNGTTYFGFKGRENGKSYNLNITNNHPALNSAGITHNNYGKKAGFYIITGTESLPLMKDRNFYYKEVDLTDNITITFHSSV